MWIKYPTKDNLNRDYKFGGIEINKSVDLNLWSRSTYSMLDFLGDLGGLFDALRYMFTLVVAPFASLNQSQFLMTSIFKQKSHDLDDSSKGNRVHGSQDFKLKRSHTKRVAPSAPPLKRFNEELILKLCLFPCS